MKHKGKLLFSFSFRHGKELTAFHQLIEPLSGIFELQKMKGSFLVIGSLCIDHPGSPTVPVNDFSMVCNGAVIALFNGDASQVQV
ncbi:MAG: hypothetical protein U9R60_04470 [Bacteroidota bacterium]|nr:hypothetical protein [Bacteroidota bacterium]